jgi:hypothetical protein
MNISETGDPLYSRVGKKSEVVKHHLVYKVENVIIVGVKIESNGENQTNPGNSHHRLPLLVKLFSRAENKGKHYRRDTQTGQPEEC